MVVEGGGACHPPNRSDFGVGVAAFAFRLLARFFFLLPDSDSDHLAAHTIVACSLQVWHKKRETSLGGWGILAISHWPLAAGHRDVKGLWQRHIL